MQISFLAMLYLFHVKSWPLLSAFISAVSPPVVARMGRACRQFSCHWLVCMPNLAVVCACRRGV